jgi:hypothetical protein
MMMMMITTTMTMTTTTMMMMMQDQFDETHMKQEKDVKQPLCDRVRAQLYCNKKRSWKFISGYVPLVKVRYNSPVAH